MFLRSTARIRGPSGPEILVLNKAFCPLTSPPPRHSLFHSFVILIWRVRKEAFFKRFCFVTYKRQALVFLIFGFIKSKSTRILRILNISLFFVWIIIFQYSKFVNLQIQIHRYKKGTLRVIYKSCLVEKDFHMQSLVRYGKKVFANIYIAHINFNHLARGEKWNPKVLMTRMEFYGVKLIWELRWDWDVIWSFSHW